MELTDWLGAALIPTALALALWTRRYARKCRALNLGAEIAGLTAGPPSGPGVVTVGGYVSDHVETAVYGSVESQVDGVLVRGSLDDLHKDIETGRVVPGSVRVVRYGSVDLRGGA